MIEFGPGKRMAGIGQPLRTAYQALQSRPGAAAIGSRFPPGQGFFLL